MRPLLTLSVGMLARFLALLSEHFARWVFQQVSEGSEAGFDLLTEFVEFCRWFVRRLASQFGGSSARRRYGEDEDDFEPGYYAN